MSGLYGHKRMHVLDEDLLPDSHYKEQLHFCNNGRQIVQTPNGNWIFAAISDYRFFPCRALKLFVSNTTALQGSDIDEAILLAGTEQPHYPLHFSHKGDLGQVAMHLDDSQQLHIFYNSEQGIHHVQADASATDLRAALSNRNNWQQNADIAPAGAILGDVVSHDDGTFEIFYEQDKNLHSTTVGGSPSQIAEIAVHPSAHVDQDGTTHLAFEHHRLIYYLQRKKGQTQWQNMSGGTEPDIAAQFCASWPSIATTNDGLVVIAYQGEGKFDLRKYKPLYDAMRAAGGSSISYAYYKDDRWQRYDVQRSSEILLKRRPHHRNPQPDPKFRPFMEELWRPSLSIDKHGVLWMMWVNTTRRHIYFSRFLGEHFDSHYEARGAYDGLDRTIFVQKDATQTDHIGFATSALKRLYFDALPVPSYASSQKRRVVMLDNLEVDQLSNLEHCLGQWEKDPKPHWGWGISGTRQEDNPAWAIVTKNDDGFEMKFMAVGGECRTSSLRGRAVSQDGLNWKEIDPLDESNLTLDGEPYKTNFWRPLYLEDPDEKDPRRRYKGLLAIWHYDTDTEIRFYKVVTSPDAVNWTTVEDAEWVCNGDISVPDHLFRDDEDPDPRRRYKFLSCTGGMSGRAIAMFTSPDLINWSYLRFLREDPDDAQSPMCAYPTGQPPLDADGGEYPWEEEIHDAYAWRENGVMMYHYDSFYFGANQHVQKALGASRDGKHFHRIKRGDINLPNGAAGDWDSGRVRTGIPTRVGDELWIYYCGMPASYFDNPDDPNYVPPMWANAWGNVVTGERQLQRPWRLGRARLRVDGWGHMQLARDAEQGRLITIPFEYSGGQLVVNGKGLEDGGLRVALLDNETKAPISGFDYDQSQFSDADSIASKVNWSGQSSIPAGNYRLGFRFDGLQSKLYAFGFED